MRKLVVSVIAVAMVLVMANGCSTMGQNSYKGFNNIKALKITDAPVAKGSLHFEKTISPFWGGVLNGSYNVGDVQVSYTVIVPPGALNNTETVTIDIPDITEAREDLGPSPYTFRRPVTVIMSFKNLPNVPDPSELQVAWFDPNANEWVVVPSTVMAFGNDLTVMFTTSHFTYWIIIDPDEV